MQIGISLSHFRHLEEVGIPYARRSRSTSGCRQTDCSIFAPSY